MDLLYNFGGGRGMGGGDILVSSLNYYTTHAQENSSCWQWTHCRKVTQRSSKKVHRPVRLPLAAKVAHLANSCVNLQNLFMAFDLPHADFAGELGGGWAVSLQGEGTVQRLLVAAPHLGEGEFLPATYNDRVNHSGTRKNIFPENLHLIMWPVSSSQRRL